jgi:hypothetical protein
MAMSLLGFPKFLSNLPHISCLKTTCVLIIRAWCFLRNADPALQLKWHKQGGARLAQHVRDLVHVGG